MTLLTAARSERMLAQHAVAHAERLAAAEPAWGTTWFPMADGMVVLQGAGLFVNRALALGLTTEVGASHLDELERAAAAVGVPASVDVVPTTDAGLRELLAARGYAPTNEVSVMAVSLGSPQPISGAADIVVRAIRSDELALWQQVSLDAWERGSDTRGASDAYAAAAHATRDEQLLLAFDVSDGRPLGCAAVVVCDGLASLGGMSTLPGERGRGVQRALVAERLRLAREAGCDTALVTAMTGSASHRNLLRLGFEHEYTKDAWTQR